MHHYHIRWSNGQIDWQVYATESDAAAGAEQLARPDETFTIVKFDGSCPRCAGLRGAATNAG